MEFTKTIITTNKKIAKLVEERLKMKKIWNNIYESDNAEDKIVLICLDKTYKDLEWFLKQFYPDKVVYVWLAKASDDLDIKSWDVTIPNTFIKTWEKHPIFLEYAIWESYDLKKFWLILSWICITWQINEAADIEDNEVYDILSILNDNKLLEKSLVIKSINTDNDDKLLVNAIDIMELVL